MKGLKELGAALMKLKELPLPVIGGAGLGVPLLGYSAKQLYLSGYGIDYSEWASLSDLSLDAVGAFVGAVLLVLAILGTLFALLLASLLVERAAYVAVVAAIAAMNAAGRERIPIPTFADWRERKETATADASVWTWIMAITTVLAVFFCMSTQFLASRIDALPVDSTVRSVIATLQDWGLSPKSRAVRIIGADQSLPEALRAAWTSCVDVRATDARNENGRERCQKIPADSLMLVARTASHAFFYVRGKGAGAVVLPTNVLRGLTFARSVDGARQPTEPSAPIPSVIALEAAARNLDDSVTALGGTIRDALPVWTATHEALAHFEPLSAKPLRVHVDGKVGFDAPKAVRLELSTASIDRLAQTLDDARTKESGTRATELRGELELRDCIAHRALSRNAWQRFVGSSKIGTDCTEIIKKYFPAEQSVADESRKGRDPASSATGTVSHSGDPTASTSVTTNKGVPK